MFYLGFQIFIAVGEFLDWLRQVLRRTTFYYSPVLSHIYSRILCRPYIFAHVRTADFLLKKEPNNFVIHYLVWACPSVHPDLVATALEKFYPYNLNLMIPQNKVKKNVLILALGWFKLYVMVACYFQGKKLFCVKKWWKKAIFGSSEIALSNFRKKKNVP